MSALPSSGDPAILAPATAAARPSGPRRRRRGDAPRSTPVLTAAIVVMALVLGACGVGRSDDDASSGDAAVDEALDARQELFVGVTFDQIDRRLDDRVAADTLTGAGLVVEPTDGEPHVHLAGAVDLDTPVPLAESSMWLTSAVLLTLVDDGVLTLDDPIGDRLPWLSAPAQGITVRQLLSHTSGLPRSVACAEPTPAACDAAIGSTALVDPPGDAFLVTDLDAHVAARLAEAATGETWDDLFTERIAEPVGMEVTSYAPPSTTGGLVAVDGTTTADDYGRFLAMVRDGGRVDGMPVLSEGSLREMLLDQTVRLDTHTEPWVAETGVPTYGLGVWRDRLRGDDVASVVSAPNRYGFYPFVDDGRSAWGIVVVDDRANPRADVVSSSALVAQLTAAALRTPTD